MDNTQLEEMPPLTPAVFHILLVLADGERHGYSIMQEITVATDGQMKIGPGTLYRSIKQMIAAGLVEESDNRPDPAMDDERRRYYCLTALGRKVAVSEATRLANLVHRAKQKQLIGQSLAEMGSI